MEAMTSRTYAASPARLRSGFATATDVHVVLLQPGDDAVPRGGLGEGAVDEDDGRLLIGHDRASFCE